jgi:hypothetical protein
MSTKNKNDFSYEAIWDNNHSSDMNYILNNYKCQVKRLCDDNEALSSVNDMLRRKTRKIQYNRKKWVEQYDYDKINVYMKKTCEKVNIDYENICDFIKNITLINYDEMIKKVKEKYNFYKRHNSGRYSSTCIIKDINDNNDVIIKKTRIKNKQQLLGSCKELLIQYYVYKEMNLSPNVHFYYLYINNNKLYSYFGMDRIRYVFYQLFDIDSMYKCYKTKNIIVLNQFVKALHIYIGSLEKMILNGILHNDSHDGNFCFNSNGKICFIDFGEVKLIQKKNNIINSETNVIDSELLTPEINSLYCKYLENELDYFLDMYYFYEDYTEEDSDKYRKFYLSEYSPVRKIHKLLEKNQYRFGYHIKYISKMIDIKLILNNIKCKLLFKD